MAFSDDIIVSKSVKLNIGRQHVNYMKIPKLGDAFMTNNYCNAVVEVRPLYELLHSSLQSTLRRRDGQGNFPPKVSRGFLSPFKLYSTCSFKLARKPQRGVILRVYLTLTKLTVKSYVYTKLSNTTQCYCCCCL